jgi:peptide deformylase
MYHTGLVGIAAPQVGHNYQIFVTHPRNTTSRKLLKEDILRIFINPKITKFSKERSSIYEGCGSVAEGDLFGPVMRSKEITIEACDENGKIFSLVCDGLLARVIQHESDHLKGVEFIQKVADYSKMLSGKFYRSTMRSSKEQLEALKISKIVIE